MYTDNLANVSMLSGTKSVIDVPTKNCTYRRQPRLGRRPSRIPKQSHRGPDPSRVASGARRLLLCSSLSVVHPRGESVSTGSSVNLRLSQGLTTTDPALGRLVLRRLVSSFLIHHCVAESKNLTALFSALDSSTYNVSHKSPTSSSSHHSKIQCRRKWPSSDAHTPGVDDRGREPPDVQRNPTRRA